MKVIDDLISDLEADAIIKTVNDAKEMFKVSERKDEEKQQNVLEGVFSLSERLSSNFLNRTT